MGGAAKGIRSAAQPRCPLRADFCCAGESARNRRMGQRRMVHRARWKDARADAKLREPCRQQGMLAHPQCTAGRGDAVKMSATDSPDLIKHIGILGAGQMGAAAAAMFRRAGFRVSLWTRDSRKLKAAESVVEQVDAFLGEQMKQPALEGGELF